MRSTETTITARPPALGGEAFQQLVEPWVPDGNHLAGPVEAHDPGRAGEGTEHQDDAAVLTQVRDRLGAASGEVQIGGPMVVQDREGPLIALGRAVDVAVGVKRRRGHEEHRLGLDEAGQPGVDVGIKAAHFPSLAPRGSGPR
ncbi:MAG TPA: hypothetical protein VN793_07305 [Acidimicrobiales bacterium]|nr:hypothetical protein [Acidimicrobiales bacterium]